MSNNSLLGRTLGNYKIDRLIGRGGMADVYHGMDINLHRPVAIKVFDSQTRTNLSQSNRFLQEARMMAQWRHNNIVQIYSAGNATGLLYYVMEFVDGYDLASIMQVYADKSELMPFADVLRIGDALASSLDYAHQQGVIHRDVKPANVMIANDGRVVLGDFGLALDIRDNRSRGEVFGSPDYISPEQARRSSDAVPQSDLYALGVILYEMLTGATPFNDPSPATLALQHITEAPPLPRTINPALTEEVEAVLLKALEKKPGDRYQSGKSLMDALRNVLTTKTAETPKDAPPLPPIPVGAPTILRSDISLNSFTKRSDVVSALEERATTSRHDIVEVLPTTPPARVGRAVFLVALLLAIIFFGIKVLPSFLSMQGQPTDTVSTPVVIATALTHINNQAANTQVSLPLPQTETAIPASVTPSNTATQIPTVTLSATPPLSTPTSPATLTTPIAPTVLYPNGYLMTAFYNANGFYMLDRAKGSRSASGFSFERVNKDGSFQNNYGGWPWEKTFKFISPTRCLSIELYPDPNPYSIPTECADRVLSNLRIAPTDSAIFWTPNDTSIEFRVLWLNQEIVRCDIAAGTCNFYVP